MLDILRMAGKLVDVPIHHLVFEVIGVSEQLLSCITQPGQEIQNVLSAKYENATLFQAGNSLIWIYRRVVLSFVLHFENAQLLKLVFNLSHEAKGLDCSCE